MLLNSKVYSGVKWLSPPPPPPPINQAQHFSSLPNKSWGSWKSWAALGPLSSPGTAASEPARGAWEAGASVAPSRTSLSPHETVPRAGDELCAAGVKKVRLWKRVKNNKHLATPFRFKAVFQQPACCCRFFFPSQVPPRIRQMPKRCNRAASRGLQDSIRPPSLTVSSLPTRLSLLSLLLLLSLFGRQHSFTF